MAADSLHVAEPDTTAFAPVLDTLELARWQHQHALTDTAAVTAATVEPPHWQEGLEPAPLPASSAADQGITTLLVALIITVTLSYRHCRRLLSSLYKELWGIRSRSRNFDEHTAGESWVMSLLGLQFVVFAGIVLDAAARWLGNPPASPAVTWGCMALVGVYYLFQIVAYNTVGYAFAPTSEARRSWLRGFNASQTLLGCAIAIPALVIVFYPAARQPMVVISALLYLLARLIFIAKGFRIFYDNFVSSLYFILYLCALELTPLIFCATIGMNLALKF